MGIAGHYGHMPLVPTARGAQIREAYESSGLSRRGFATRSEVPDKSITNITSGGICSRPRAVRIARALNEVEGTTRWTAEMLFTEPADAETVPV